MMESPPAANSNEILNDLALPFVIESSGIAGRFVRLNNEIHTILSGHKYPVCVSQLLGELLVLSAMLGTMLKLDGMLTIQVQGDGAVDFISADYTSAGHLRGYARIRDRKYAQSVETSERKRQDIGKLLGRGHVVVTIENKGGLPYQAIVPLEGKSLSECIIGYFKQSKQLDAMIEVAVMKQNNHWTAGGMVLQRVPDAEDRHSEDQQQDWKTAGTLLASVTDTELVDHTLPPNTLLYRLFHEDGVRVFEAQKLKAICRCSREKIVQVLRTLSADELHEMVIDGVVSVRCHFCNRSENFEEGDW